MSKTMHGTTDDSLALKKKMQYCSQTSTFLLLPAITSNQSSDQKLRRLLLSNTGSCLAQRTGMWGPAASTPQLQPSTWILNMSSRHLHLLSAGHRPRLQAYTCKCPKSGWAAYFPIKWIKMSFWTLASIPAKFPTHILHQNDVILL